MKMVAFFLLLASTLSVAAASAKTELDPLMVVGVYRPLELDGRRVHTPRIIYLKGVEGREPPSVGDVLGIFRMSGQQAQFGSLYFQEPTFNPFADLNSERPLMTQRPAPISRSQIRRGARFRLKPAARLHDTDLGRPAAFSSTRAASPTRRLNEAPQMSQTGLFSGVDSSMVRVGAVRVTNIRGETIIGEIVEDGLSKSETDENREELRTLAIMVGDVAKIETGQVASKSVVKILKPINRKQLNRERDRLARDLKRKSRKPKPYRRAVMKWDL
ncbi:MAG: hypothetical protein CMH52_03170 [Myxococcales bacterium]|nr:hypothetical protein [Myxococcales bacterium]